MLQLDFEPITTLVNQEFTIFEVTSTFRIAIIPVAYVILYVRFTSLVHAEKKISTPPEAQHLIPVVGYTLPDRDFHPARKCQALLGAPIVC